MKRRSLLIFCLGACLISMACPSGPSSSGREKAAALENRIEFLNGLLSERALASRVFGDLSAALPGGVWLTEIVYDNSAVRAKGYAPSNTVVADYVSKLGESPSLKEATLQASVQRRIRNREFEEFSIQASARIARGESPSGPASGAGPGDIAALTGQLAELEKTLTSENDSAGMLRKFQQAASDSGLKIARFAPGRQTPGQFYTELLISVDVTGPRQGLERYLTTIAEMPGLWVVKKLTTTAASAQDADSPIRASLSALAYSKNRGPGPSGL